MDKTRHYALIPAKKESRRCPEKNWRDFSRGDSLVNFAVKTVPRGFFERIIISTDRVDYSPPGGVELHLRDRALAREDSAVTELINVIVKKYGMIDGDYLWLLNPTSPFRTGRDYRMIAEMIDTKKPEAVISVVKASPFLWRDARPVFETTGKRPNTQDFSEEYLFENGMFYVMNIGFFAKNGSWYGEGVSLYRQEGIRAYVDIDSETDFREAQKIESIWKENTEGG